MRGCVHRDSSVPVLTRERMSNRIPPYRNVALPASDAVDMISSGVQEEEQERAGQYLPLCAIREQRGYVDNAQMCANEKM